MPSPCPPSTAGAERRRPLVKGVRYCWSPDCVSMIQTVSTSKQAKALSAPRVPARLTVKLPQEMVVQPGIGHEHPQQTKLNRLRGQAARRRSVRAAVCSKPGMAQQQKARSAPQEAAQRRRMLDHVHKPVPTPAHSPHARRAGTSAAAARPSRSLQAHPVQPSQPGPATLSRPRLCLLWSPHRPLTASCRGTHQNRANGTAPGS